MYFGIYFWFNKVFLKHSWMYINLAVLFCIIYLKANYAVYLWDWAEFTLLDLVPHPLWFFFPYFPTWLLSYSFTWISFLGPFCETQLNSSNPPHAPPCSHIVCNMYGACGSLWLGILCSSDTVTSCGLPNMPGILSVFYTSCIAFFCCCFVYFLRIFGLTPLYLSIVNSLSFGKHPC